MLENEDSTRWHHNLGALFIPVFVGEGRKPQIAALGLLRTFLSCSDLGCFGVGGQDTHSSVYVGKQSRQLLVLLRAQLPKGLQTVAPRSYPLLLE